MSKSRSRIKIRNYTIQPFHHHRALFKGFHIWFRSNFLKAIKFFIILSYFFSSKYALKFLSKKISDTFYF